MAGETFKNYPSDLNKFIDELLNPSRQFGRDEFLEGLISGTSTTKLAPQARGELGKAAQAEQSKGQRTRKLQAARSFDRDTMARVFSRFYPDNPLFKALVDIANDPKRR